MLRLIALLLLGVISICAAVDPHFVTIHRDTWGVPHFYAKTDACRYRLMYAQAEDNFWQLETAKAAYSAGNPKLRPNNCGRSSISIRGRGAGGLRACA
jgi:acyl-homoserine lactone acylase PvdQ